MSQEAPKRRRRAARRARVDQRDDGARAGGSSNSHPAATTCRPLQSEVDMVEVLELIAFTVWDEVEAGRLSDPHATAIVGRITCNILALIEGEPQTW